uniref:NRDE family protein n=1 Tax=Fulvivirga sp. TaxID=1931237 RepID=UPI00404B7606
MATFRVIKLVFCTFAPYTIEELMCLILFAYQSHSEYKLILTANRDEFYARPTQQAHFWPDSPHILAGKDLQAGGTWIGVNKNGKLAALTNYRDPANINPDAPSRGALTIDFLKSDLLAKDYLLQLDQNGLEYNGFNLLLMDESGLWCYDNVQRAILQVPTGVHGLSNATLNTPWPKTESAKQQLKEIINTESISKAALVEMMENKTTAPDEMLPKTGVPYHWEKLLSARFIESEFYGSRITTVITISNSREINFLEKTHPIIGHQEKTVEFMLEME